MRVANVPILAVGKWNNVDFSSDDLDAILSSFDELRLAGKLPVKLGHGADDTQPAQGWITALRRDGDQLFADLDQVPDELVEEIMAGRWRHVSVELLRHVKKKGKKFPWVLDGVAVLGAVRPAVDVLDGLHTLFSAGVPGLKFTERLSFSREIDPETPVARLRREVREAQAETLRLNHQLALAEIDRAINMGTALPRERAGFLKEHGDKGTLEQARVWLANAPRPPRQGMAPMSRVEPEATTERPDEEMVVRVEKLRQKKRAEGIHLDYVEASRMVLRGDPELARRYVGMPSELWGRG